MRGTTNKWFRSLTLCNFLETGMNLKGFCIFSVIFALGCGEEKIVVFGHSWG
jgi:hypothetical protein